MKLKQTHAAKMARRRTITCCVALLLVVSLIVGISSCISGKKAKKAAEEEAAAKKATTSQNAKDNLDKLIDNMSLDQKIAQLFMISPEALTGADVVSAAGEQTKNSLTKYPVGGIVYTEANLSSDEQVKSMLMNTQTYLGNIVGIPAFIAIAEEGGDNSPVAAKLKITQFASPYTYAEKENGVEELATNMSDMAKQLKMLGFNLNLAPYADCCALNDSAAGPRSYGSDYQKAADLVAAAVKGLRAGGVGSCLKYFPSIGDYDAGGNLVCNGSLADLKAKDFLPFQSGITAGADIVQVGHVQTAAAEAGVPSDFSKKVVTDLLRNTLGFKGVIMTASLGDSSVSSTYSTAQMVVKALQAGCDLIYNPTSLYDAVAAVKDAITTGNLSEARINQSVKRILTAKINLGIMSMPTDSAIEMMASRQTTLPTENTSDLIENPGENVDSGNTTSAYSTTRTYSTTASRTTSTTTKTTTAGDPNFEAEVN